jgi:hypothetical protein
MAFENPGAKRAALSAFITRSRESKKESKKGRREEGRSRREQQEGKMKKRKVRKEKCKGGIQRTDVWCTRRV